MTTRLSSLAVILLFGAGAASAAPVYGIPPGEEPIRTFGALELDSDKDVEDWSLPNLNVPPAWKVNEGKDVIVAILDTGCDLDHPDLVGQVIASKDFTGSASGVDDRNGHGTWCAGAVAAKRDGKGMVGVSPKTKLLIAKVLGDNGSGSTTGIALAIRWATDKGAHIISMSLGGPDPDDDIPDAIAYARSKGVIVVAAAGNEGKPSNWNTDTTGYPARYPGVLAIAAHDTNNVMGDFSSRGAAVYCSGPGVNSRSTAPGGKYSTISGTSMACPRVAGVIALYLAARPALPKDAARPDIVATDLRMACPRPNNRSKASGFGKPDTMKLVTVVMIPGPHDPSTGFVLTELSLTEAERARLKQAGVERFTVSVNVPLPKPKAGEVVETKEKEGPVPERKVTDEGQPESNTIPKAKAKKAAPESKASDDPAPAPRVAPDPKPAIDPKRVSPFGPDYEWGLFRGVYGWIHKSVKR